MPRIEEYLPESSGAGPVGGLDPRTEAVGRVGQGIEKVGQSLEAVGMRELHAQSQTDAADAAEAASQNRVDYNQRVIEENQNGTIDPDKIRQDYQDQVDKQAQNFPTALGRNTFLRMSARVGASVQIAAIHGKAQVEGAKAANSWVSTQNANANSLYQDPSSFDDVQAQTLEAIDAQVQAGGIKAVQAEKLKTEAGANNAAAAIRGWTRLGATQYQDKDGKQIDGPAIAQNILDSGKLDQYLTPLQKENLYTHIATVNKANDAAAWVQERQLQRQNKEAFDGWLGNNLSAYASGNLNPRDVLNAPGDVEMKKRLIDQIKTNAVRDKNTNPVELNKVMRQLVLPDGNPNKITDPMDVLTNKNLTPLDQQRALHFYDNTPQAKELRASRHDIFSAAAKIITPKDNNPLSATFGQGSPNAAAKLSQFKIDLANEETARMKAGTPVKDLYDPSKPGNAYEMLKSPKYAAPNPLTDFANSKRDDNRKTAPPEFVRKPGETIQDFDKRRGVK